MSQARTAIGSTQDQVWTDDAPYLTCERQWDVVGHGSGYILRLVQVPISFEFLHVRRERGDLVGQLRVMTDLTGTRGWSGTLNAGTLNLSSPTQRKARAGTLEDLSRAPHIDWLRLLEEFSIRVHTADGEGDPGVWLHNVKPTTQAVHLDVDGLELTRKHSNLLFGESDTFKSWKLLRVLGDMAIRGINVALLDYELDEDAYAARSVQLFGVNAPPILYLACSKSLALEFDRVQREFHRHKIAFCGLDSVVPACGSSSPNDAEAANELIGTLRRLDVGSLLVAHVPKSAAGQQGDEKPFGSQFWFNLCRSIYYVARTSTADPVVCGYYHRKSSLSRRRAAFGLSWQFDDAGAVTVSRVDLADTPELAAKQSTWERMRDLLRHGPLSPAEVADRLDIKSDTIRKTLQRSKAFKRIDCADGSHKLALVERRWGAA